MDGSELQEFIDRYNAAWNAHDVDAIVAIAVTDLAGVAAILIARG